MRSSRILWGTRWINLCRLALLMAIALGVSLNATTVAAQEAGTGSSYIIQHDDTLWKIAEKFLGDGNLYNEIITATNAKSVEDATYSAIQDANIITLGAKLWIPGVEEIAANGTTAPAPSLPADQTSLSSATEGSTSANIAAKGSPGTARRRKKTSVATPIITRMDASIRRMR